MKSGEVKVGLIPTHATTNSFKDLNGWKINSMLVLKVTISVWGCVANDGHGTNFVSCIDEDQSLEIKMLMKSQE